MPRRTQRSMGLQQLGQPGERYHETSAATGEPKYTKAGNPKMAWRYGEMPSFEHGSTDRAVALANVVHSIRTASPEDVKHGMEWYPRVHEAVAKGVRQRGFMSGASNKMLSGAGIVAAVSPNMDWDRNNIGAFKELASLKSSHWSQIAAGDRSALQGMSISAAATPNLMKAHRLIQGADPTEELHPGRAPKTHSFMHNIADPTNPQHVTIDGRAFDTMTNRMRSWEVNRGLTGGKAMSGRYQNARSVWQSVAHDMDIHPSAAQAVSWSSTKYGLEQQGRRRKQGPARVGQPYFHPETGAPALHPGQFNG